MYANSHSTRSRQYPVHRPGIKKRTVMAWRAERVIAVVVLLSALLCETTEKISAQEPEYLWSIEESLWRGPSVGEDYTVELTAGLWNPIPVIVASSEQFGIPGSDIHFGNDLGLARTSHPDFRLTFKPGRKHKLRVSLVPIEYAQQRVLARPLVFQGIKYDANIPVASTFQWDAWRFGYEYDIVSRQRGYFGILLEAKYTRLAASLTSADAQEYVRAQAPIPALGAILRVYPTRFTPLTVEFTAFKLPGDLTKRLPGDLSADYRGQYVDLDVYATLNLSRMVGINLGYRSVDFNYLIDRDAGDLKLAGFYASGTVRF